MSKFAFAADNNTIQKRKTCIVVLCIVPYSHRIDSFGRFCIVTISPNRKSYVLHITLPFNGPNSLLNSVPSYEGIWPPIFDMIPRVHTTPHPEPDLCNLFAGHLVVTNRQTRPECW